LACELALLGLWTGWLGNWVCWVFDWVCLASALMFIFCGLHGILSAVAEFPALIIELFTVNSRVANKQGVYYGRAVLVNVLEHVWG
jgi:hypothetical protein